MLGTAKNIFIVGIKGVAMANLAVILKKMGKSVAGSDLEEEFITDELLKKNNISYSLGFQPEDLPRDTDLVVYSAAHGGTNNPQIIEAEKRGIKTVSQAQIIADLLKSFKTTIAISGCHGKTTTSSFLSYALIQLKEKPSYLVGAPSFNEYAGGNYSGKNYFIVEADEYGVNPPNDLRPKFHFLNPDHIICTNIDFDHPDVYRNLEETKKAFLQFFKKLVRSHPKGDQKLNLFDTAAQDRLMNGLIVCADDKNLIKVAQKLPRDHYTTYGFSKKADFVISNVQTTQSGTTFNLQHKNMLLGNFSISLFGDKNVSNATAVIVMLVTLGFPVDKIQTAIKNFTGAKRRFEKVFENKRGTLYDDYGHHPHEIEATIAAARKHFPNKRVIIIFQPHTYSRTQMFLKEFAQALSLADYSYILPIFTSAREDIRKFSVKSEDIIKQAVSNNLSYIEDNVQLINRLYMDIKKGDMIFTMGAGDVYKLKDDIIKLVQSSKFKVQNDNVKLKVEKNKELFPYVTLRTRTKAEYFVDAKSREELIAARKYATENGTPFFILGGGSNLAVTKDIIKGLVVKNSYQKTEVIHNDSNSVDFLVSSGYPVSRLVQETVEKGYEGFEYQKGLPGTVGGAIYMNSKWTKPVSYFGDALIYAYLINDRGEVIKVNRQYFQFGYDYSILQKTKEIVLEAVFRLKKISPEVLAKRAKESFEYRLKTQPFGVATSGCFFRNIPEKIKKEKNLPTTSAGYLIDKAGLKGYIVGDFAVSEKHANFILNNGNGKPEDLIELLSVIKNKVKEKFGVELTEEVIIV